MSTRGVGRHPEDSSSRFEGGSATGAACLAAVLVALGAAGLLGVARDQIHPANAALVLMLVVIGTAMAAGRAPALAAATAGALGFNYFSTEPYLTLRITDPSDALTFVLLFGGGLAVSQLSHIAAERARRADRQRLGVQRLHELTDLSLRSASAEVLLDRASAYLVDELGLRACEYVWGDEPTHEPDLDHRGVIDGPLRHVRGGFELPRGGLSLPVRTPSGEVLGRFHLVPSPDRGVSLFDREVALLVADLLAPSLADRRRRTGR